MTQVDYDVAVVGAGPGGYVAAIRAAQLGMRTVLIEKADLGGICLNWGCIPTKALLRSADVLRQVRAAQQYGVRVSEPDADLSAMVARSRQVAGQLQRGVAHLMKKNGVEVLQAQATLAGNSRLNITPIKSDAKPSQLKAKSIILATGARARKLPDMTPDPSSVWYYREALAPTFLPRRMMVIGAGAIGVEFASFYNTLGVQVHILEMADRVLPTEDKEISDSMAKALTSQGIKLHLGAKITSTLRSASGWQINIAGHSHEVDVVLVAAGIEGNTENLGLENTAVRVDRTHIETDPWCQTNEPGVYAIGDVAGAPWLAHKASHEAVLCVEHIADLAVEPLDANRIPACTYSYPQVAHVGLTEEQARATGQAIKVGKFPFAANGKSIAMGETDGFVKVIFDSNTGELLGAHMIGAEVTEMIQGYGIAMGLETTEAELIKTVFAHPTQSEAMHEAVLSAYTRVLHI